MSVCVAGAAMLAGAAVAIGCWLNFVVSWWSQRLDLNILGQDGEARVLTAISDQLKLTAEDRDRVCER